MSSKIQFRRGVDAGRGTVVLDAGEPGWTTDTKELYVGDGVTYGGILITGGGGAGTLCDLSDVSCAGTVDGRALTYQAGTWVSRGTVVAEQIPSLPSSRITTGTFGLARIPAVDDARIPDLETLSYGAAFATAQVPAIGAYKTTTGTFVASRIPILPTDRYGSAVLLTGAQSIGGTKTFTDIPILPASDPTADNEAARKAYVDSAAAGHGFSAYRNAEQTINNETFTTIIFETEIFDADNDYNTATGRYTPQQSGYYICCANVTLKDLADGAKYICQLLKNTTVAAVDRSVVGGADYVGACVSSVIYLNGSTDYVQCKFYHNHGASRVTLNVQGYVAFSAWLLLAP